jgi:hypothetical protein
VTASTRNMLVCGAVDATACVGALLLLFAATGGFAVDGLGHIAKSALWISSLAFVFVVVLAAGALDARALLRGDRSLIRPVLRGASGGLAIAVFLNCLMLVTKAAYAVEGSDWPFATDASGASYLDWPTLGSQLLVETAVAAAVGAVFAVVLSGLNRSLLRRLPS